MKKGAAAILSASILMFTACQPPEDPLKVEILPLENEQQKHSYAMGANVGHIIEDKLATQQELGIEYDKALLVEGFIAAIQGQSQLEKKDIQTITRDIEKQVRDKKQTLRAKMSEENLAAGLEFLAANAKRPGIEVTDSGLQYEVLRQGEGAKPKATNTVKVDYVGTLLNGTEFDSSYARGKPATFPLSRVIKGWTEGLQLMNEGSKFKFYIPSNLAYGARNTGKISSHSTLIFEVELLEIVDDKKPATK